MEENSAGTATDDFEDIEFNLITEDLIPSVLDLMWEEYVPNEPLSRSLGVKRSWFGDQLHTYDHLIHGGGVVAIRDGQVIGYRCGKVVTKNSCWIEWFLIKLFSYLALFLNRINKNWFLSTSIELKLEKALDYNTWNSFTHLNCSSIYEDRGVCVSRSARRLGLGTELIRRGELVAKWLGCEYTVNVATSNYSVRLFEKLGYTRLKEVEYDTFRDEEGETYLKDTGEHRSAVNFIKALE